MSIVLFGTTDFTLSIANFLVAKGYPLCAIIGTDKDFNISYSKTLVTNQRFTDIKKTANELGVIYHHYLDNDNLYNFLSELKADFALIAGWYHMVPEKIRNLFHCGCAGIHASLLPQYRGGAPLNWALINGEKETGVTLFELTNGVDDGSIYGQMSFPIESDDSIVDLINRSETYSKKILDDCLNNILSKKAKKVSQQGLPSYCLQRRPEDSKINWNSSATDISLLVRASSKPYAGAYSYFDEKKVIIWKSKEFVEFKLSGKPGQILFLKEFEYPIVKTNDSAIMILEAEDELKVEALTMLRKASHKRFSLS